MLTLWFGVLGLGVGFFLDSLIGRLAVPFDEDLDEEPTAESAPARLATDETGSLVVPIEGIDWRRRALVMAATAALFAMVALRFAEPAHQVVACVYVCVLLLCATTDLLVYRVPNPVTYPAMLGAIIVGVIVPHANIWDVLAGGAMAGGVLLVPSLLTGGAGMGMGDVKLAGFVGLAVGFALTAPAMLVMAISGGAIATMLLLTGLRKKGEPIPYAPFISAGGLVVLLWFGSAFAAAG